MFRRVCRRFWVHAALAGLVVGAPACTAIRGGEAPRQPVAGLVLMDGRPLENGTILFYSGENVIPGTSIVAAQPITNGRFALSRENGLAAGSYRIAISVLQGAAHPGKTAKPDEASKELIPARFNSQTELRVDVKEGGIKELRIAIAST